MDFHALPRRDLQTLCKRNKIPANMTNVAMADALQALPAVEGLEALIQDAQQYLSPNKAAAGMPEPPSRSCRRTTTSTRNPPGSSVPRTRPAGKNQAAAAEKEDDDVVGHGVVGIPNSPTTLNSRGRRTRTLVIAGCRETEEDEVEAVKKVVEPLPLEIPKTPATRATRGRRAANQEMAVKQDEDGAPAVPQTPGATTARRASTRRGGARAAAPAQEEASGARSTRYRTRRAVVEEAAAETETAARTRTTAASRKNSKKADVAAADGGVLPGDVSVAGEDGAEGEAPAGEVVAAGGGAAETEISLPVPEVDGSDGLRVDQTMEKTNPTDVIVVEEAGSEGVDQTAAEETISDDPAIVDLEVPMVDSIDQTMDKADEIADQTVVVEESHDSTVGDAPSDQTAAEETILDDPTVVDEERPMLDSIKQTMDLADEPVDQTVEVEESHDSTVRDAPSDDQGVVVEEKVESFEGHVDQTAVEELILSITEISLDSTVDEEEIPVAVVWEDQTAHDGSDLFPVEVQGHVDPTVQEIRVSAVDCDVEKIDPTVGDGDETQVLIVDSDTDLIDPTSEEGDEISACDGDVEKIDPTVGDGDETQVSVVDSDAETIDPTAEEGDEISACDVTQAASPEETPMVGDSHVAGVLASLATDVVVVSAGDEIIPAETEEQGEEEKEEETQQQPSMGGDASSGDEIIPFEAEEQGEEVEDREEEIQETQQQPSIAAYFLHGEQDKENAAAVKACLMSPPPKQHQQMAAAAVKYDNTTSLRKLKAAYKDVWEEKQKKRAALAALDDNCITSPSQFF